MNKSWLAIWALLPLGAWAYHEGPGQDRLQRDEADALARTAHDDARNERWSAAVEGYGAALAALPEGELAVERQLRLERAKALMQDAGLPEAREELLELVAELQTDEGADPELVAAARSALANARYYMTWLMRLEGMPREEWEPEIEGARQAYRLLAEEAVERGDEAALDRNRGDLEAAIRLARMELTELQGLPLPSV